MNYFGTNIVNQPDDTQFEAPVYEGVVSPSGTAIMDIVLEAMREDYQLQAALEIADAQMTLKAVTESVEAAEVVLEGVLGNTFSKIKDGLKKLWAKVKAWFKSVRESLTMLFSKGKTFITKYKKTIQEKPARGFEYKGYVWSVDAGNTKAQSAISAIADGVESITSKLGSDVDSITAAAAAQGMAAGAKDEYDSSEIQDQIVGKVSDKIGSGSKGDLSDIKEAIFKAYRSGAGDGDTEDLKEFSKVTRGTLIDLVDKSDKSLKTIADAEKAADKTFANSLKLISKAETAVGKLGDSSFQAKGSGADNSDNAVAGRRAKAATFASKIAFATRYGQTLNSAIASAAVESVKASASEAERVLKRFVSYGGSKENLDENPEDFDGAESVLEGFMTATGI